MMKNNRGNGNDDDDDDDEKMNQTTNDDSSSCSKNNIRSNHRRGRRGRGRIDDDDDDDDDEEMQEDHDDDDNTQEQQDKEEIPDHHGDNREKDDDGTSTTTSSPENHHSNPSKTKPRKTRLMITKMVLENFKSYGGIQVIGPFHKSYTAIVGPNGSGKSNVIDAMLFVFGKRAKKLRLNKVSQLIHKSSNSWSNNKKKGNNTVNEPPKFARVTVHMHEIYDDDDDDDSDKNDANIKNNNNNMNEEVQETTDTNHGKTPSKDGDDHHRGKVHRHCNNNNGDDDNYIIVPDSETILTRIAKMDNTSQYQLNGKNCPFKTVATFLNSKGIDLHNNRFLILQGEVELISMMPPKGTHSSTSSTNTTITTTHSSTTTNKNKDGTNNNNNNKGKSAARDGDEGLLEYLEDIIGSSQFVEATEEAAASMELLTEQRQERLHRSKATEKELKSLESAKTEALTLLGKDRDIRRKQNILYQIHQYKLQDEINKYKEQLDKVNTSLQNERTKLSKAEQSVQEHENTYNKERKEYDTIHHNLMKNKDDFSSCERKHVKLHEEMKHLQISEKKLKAKIQLEINKEEKAIAREQQDKDSIPILEEKIEQITSIKAKEDVKLEKIYDEMKDKTHTLRIELEQKTQELVPIQQELITYQTNLDTAITQRNLLTESKQRMIEKLQNAKIELQTIDQTQNNKRNELKLKQQQLQQTNDKLSNVKQEDHMIEQKEIKLAQRHKELVARYEEAKAVQESTGRNRRPAVAALLKATEKGGELSKCGVLGRFGDLATIAPEYDIAVSTACGMLDHIVVQTTAGAQRCLDYLRKYKLGRANFIPLDKMKKGTHDRTIQTPEDAPRLFDLITPINYTITPALFLAVGHTLVAPDLTTATRWAYDFNKRWRVVTMDGKLIDSIGTMSGGGKTMKRGGMKLASARSKATVQGEDNDDEVFDCEKLEKDAAEAHDLLMECRKRRKELIDEIHTLSNDIKSIEKNIPKLNMEIASCDTTRQELTRLIPDLQSQINEQQQCDTLNNDQNKLDELNKKIDTYQEEMSSCSKHVSDLEEQVAVLQKAILDAGGTKLKKQQTICDKALTDLNATEKALNTARVSITSMQKAAKKAQATKVDCENQLEECKAALETTKTELETLEQDTKRVTDAYEKVKILETEKRVALDDISKECDRFRTIVSDIKGIEIELFGKVNASQKGLTETMKKQQHWIDEISKLQQAAEAEEEEYNDLDIPDLPDDDDDDDGDDDEEQEDAKGSAEDGDDDDMDCEDNDKAKSTTTAHTKKTIKSKSLPTFHKNTLRKYDVNEIKNDISILQNERNSIAKNANMGAIAEYRKKEKDYENRLSELADVTAERNAVRKTHEDLRRQRLEMFMDGFGQITLKLKEMYQMITLGGDAELELVDSLDPFSEGIVFSVRPPKKSWKNISNLSGGEKTLSSLALVFALHHYRPTPLYVMDEIDAALDFKNVSIVANYIKERTKNAQFIIISLRNNMFELADRLTGIYKTYNCTKSVTINPDAFGVKGQQNGYTTNTSRSIPPTTTPGGGGALLERSKTDKTKQQNKNNQKSSVMVTATIANTNNNVF